MLNQCLGILRKHGCPALSEALTAGDSTLSYSALESILLAGTGPSLLFTGVKHLVLEAPQRSDLPLDELTVMREMLRVHEELLTTIFISPEAHSWCLDPSRTPEGSDALIRQLSNHCLKPRLFIGPLSRLTREELQIGWTHLENNQIYTMASIPQPQHTSPKDTRSGWRFAFWRP